MPQLTLTIPTDCPNCRAKACGHPCDCGYVEVLRTQNDQISFRVRCERPHRFCDKCGLCYEPVEVEEYDST